MYQYTYFNIGLNVKHLYLSNDPEVRKLLISTKNKALYEDYSCSSWWQWKEEMYRNSFHQKNIISICRNTFTKSTFKIHVIMAIQSNKSFKEIYAKI